MFSGIFAITERRDVGLYEVSLSMSFLGFGMGTSTCVVLCFKNAREESESKRAYMF